MRVAKSVLVGFLLGALSMQGCEKVASTPPLGSQPASTAAVATTAATQEPQQAPAVQPAYTPPTAAELIQLLAPIAAFPDNLVAQILAASSYPDQVGAAYTWSNQNPKLKDAELQQALDGQPWDPSVKAIAAFPEVLRQMATNIAWMTALGEAYVNDPTDVMNGIQQLRQQALACGNLKSNSYVNVTRVPKQPITSPTGTSTPTIAELEFLGSDEPATYSGPSVIPAPVQVIEIAPTHPDIVYVPTYDPAVFYGTSIVAFPGYAYAWPAPIYYGPVFGGWGFGLGISVRFGFAHPWGWWGWGIHWGRGFGYPRYGFGFHRPAVVFNNRIYVSHSTTIINRFETRGPRQFVSSPGAGQNPGMPNARAPTPVSLARDARVTPATVSRLSSTNFNRMTVPHFTNSMATSAQSNRSIANAKANATHVSAQRLAAATTASSSRTSIAGLASNRLAPTQARTATSISNRSVTGAANSRTASPGQSTSRSTGLSSSRSYPSASGPHKSFTNTSHVAMQTSSNRGSTANHPASRLTQAQKNSASHYAAPSASRNNGRGYASAPHSHAAATPHLAPHLARASATASQGTHSHHR
jgi:hypothetical protein